MKASTSSKGRESFSLHLIDFGRSRVIPFDTSVDHNEDSKITYQHHTTEKILSLCSTAEAMKECTKINKSCDMNMMSNCSEVKESNLRQKIFDIMLADSLDKSHTTNSSNYSQTETIIKFNGFDLWTYKLTQPLMKQKLSTWTHEADYIGVSNCIHELLFYEEMKIITIDNNNNTSKNIDKNTTTNMNNNIDNNNTSKLPLQSTSSPCRSNSRLLSHDEPNCVTFPSQFMPRCTFKRYWNKDLWTTVFQMLLNDTPSTFSTSCSSPLRLHFLLTKLDEILDEENKKVELWVS